MGKQMHMYIKLHIKILNHLYEEDSNVTAPPQLSGNISQTI